MMTNKSEPDMAGCAAVVIWMPIYTLASAVTFGFAAKVLWGWFVVPVFVGVPVLTFAQASGIMITLAAFRPRPSDNDDRDVWDIIGESVFRLIAHPVVYLGAGWLVKAVFL